MPLPADEAILTTLIFLCVTFLPEKTDSHLVKKWFPSWPDILNRKLTLYEPKSVQAWDILCGHVLEKKMLTPDDVTAWLLAEKASGVNGGAGRYSFLNTETGEQSDERKH